MQVIKYMFQPHGDEHSQLIALEEFNDIPFRIKRVYYMYDTPQEMRMFISEKISNQIFISVIGQKAKQLKIADFFLNCLNQLVDKLNCAA